MSYFPPSSGCGCAFALYVRGRGVLEAADALPQLFGGFGMDAQRTAWTIAFRVEAAALSAQEHAVAIFDVVEAFERGPRHLLAVAVARKGYPSILP